MAYISSLKDFSLFFHKKTALRGNLKNPDMYFVFVSLSVNHGGIFIQSYKTENRKQNMITCQEDNMGPDDISLVRISILIPKIAKGRHWFAFT